jgi:hypothetical protein
MATAKERLGVDRGFFHHLEILEKNLIRNKKVPKVNSLCLTPFYEYAILASGIAGPGNPLVGESFRPSWQGIRCVRHAKRK